MSEETPWSYGRVAFETYKNHVDGMTFDGRDIPPWDDMTDLQIEAWDLAAMGAIQEYKLDGIVDEEEDHW